MFTESCFIPDMRDPATAERLVAALAACAGVVRVRADLPNRRLILTYDAPALPEQLRALLEGMGYPVANGLTPLYPAE